MQIIYPDVLFLINFCMDFIALYLSGTFLHAVKNKKHLLFASFIGAVFSVFLLIFNTSEMFGFVIGAFLSVLVCYVGYGAEIHKKRFFRLLASFYVVSLLLGGAVTAFYNCLYNFFRRNEVEVTYERNKVFVFFAVSLLCSAIVYLFAHMFNSSNQEHDCKITIYHGGREKSFGAIVDSGNLLKDPFFGTPVIVMSIGAMYGLLPDNAISSMKSWGDGVWDGHDFASLKFRIIPCNSIGGEKMLIAFKPDVIEIVIEKNEKVNKYRVDALIGFNDFGKFNGLEAIVPSSLIM